MGRVVQLLLHYTSGNYHVRRECVFVALVTERELRMRPIFACCLPAITYIYIYIYISTLPHKRHDIRENVTDPKTLVFVFSTKFVGKISHSKKNSVSYNYSALPTLITCFDIISYLYSFADKNCTQPEDGHSNNGRNM